MIRTVLIDEDKDAREDTLKKISAVAPEIFILSSVSDIQAGCRVIEEQDPELVISEAYFTGKTAYRVFDELPDIHFKLIILTDSHEYAIEAVKLSAVDYLIKPVVVEELKMALEKARKLIKEDSLLESWLMSKNLLREDNPRKKIAVNEDGTVFILQVSDIIYLKASDDGMTEFIVRESRKIHVSKPYTKYLEMLKDYGFIRIGKTYLVNCSYIERFDRSDGGYIILKGSYRLPVATREKEQLLTTFRQIS
jgi:two-component system LytT family response regulator